MKMNISECCTTCKTKESTNKCKESSLSKNHRQQIMHLHKQGMSVEDIVKKMYKIERNPPYVISDNPTYLPRLEAKIKLVQSIINGEV